MTEPSKEAFEAARETDWPEWLVELIGHSILSWQELYRAQASALDAFSAARVAEAHTEWAKYDEAIRAEARAQEREAWENGPARCQ